MINFKFILEVFRKLESRIFDPADKKTDECKNKNKTKQYKTKNNYITATENFSFCITRSPPDTETQSNTDSMFETSAVLQKSRLLCLHIELPNLGRGFHMYGNACGNALRHL